MKKIMALAGLFFVLIQGQAQSREEWTQQDKTRIKRLLEQIAANRVYMDYMKKGYRIVATGLQTIRDIKNGDLQIHARSIDSLKIVNPAIKKWQRIADIINEQMLIINSIKQALAAIHASGQFTPDELHYCKNVFDHLLQECEKNIEQLYLVISNGALEMKDAERIEGIEKIYLAMKDKSAFVLSFSDETGVLALQRITEKVETDYSKKLRGY